MIKYIKDSFLFFFIVRKPPFDYESVKSYIDLIDSISSDVYENNLIITDDDLVSEDLQYYDSEVYCWYSLESVSNTEGLAIKDPSDLSLPIVYFREYNEIWGNIS